jgi:integrase/recombinase XerD
MTPLRQRMTEDLEIRNYSPKTIHAYVRAVAKFAEHFWKSPDQLGPEHIRAYQVFLVKEKQASWSQFNQAVSALKFLYGTTLQKDWLLPQIPFSKVPRTLPIVLSVEEVAMFLRAIDNLKHRTMFMTIYSTGLRVSEVVNLLIADVDSQRQVIRVCQGKGKKDRYVPLFPSLLTALRSYWREYKPRRLLFPSRGTDYPLAESALQRVCAEKRQALNLSKRVTPHTFRHYPESRIMPSASRKRVV